MNRFYYTILFRCSKKYQTKFSTLFCYENSKQKGTPTNCIQSLIRFDFRDFMNLYKKYTTEPYSSWVIDTNLLSDNSLRFRKNLLETI